MSRLKVSEPTVRKHIERICEKFGLRSEHTDSRRYKRSELVTLVAKYKPNLLTEYQLKFTDKVAEITDKDDNNICEFILQLLSVNQPINEEFKKFILRFNCNEPDLAAAHYNLGATYEKIDHWTQAREHYKIAMQYQNRAGEAAMNNLARLEILQGNSSAAVEMISPILSKVKDHTVKAALHKNLGWAYFQQNFYEQAKQHLFISLELENDYAPTYCLLAQVQAAVGDKENSLIFWRKFLESYSQGQELKSVQWHLPELEIWKLDAMRNIMETAI
ncbi:MULTISPECIES: tetratricopeptide repeat protein [Aphanizomenon]|uniref:tetratricopeptide repeat protein n=1 Tax=Aphanizomenon TaxID=1175 RepID=UPI000691EBD1|nr:MULTISPECIES: tetratricopeptide repeat protein [Aphanizomenon]